MFTKEKEKTEKIGQSRASYTMVLMMMTKERKQEFMTKLVNLRLPISSPAPALHLAPENKIPNNILRIMVMEMLMMIVMVLVVIEVNMIINDDDIPSLGRAKWVFAAEQQQGRREGGCCCLMMFPFSARPLSSNRVAKWQNLP